jgi:hypothetical protein
LSFKNGNFGMIIEARSRMTAYCYLIILLTWHVASAKETVPLRYFLHSIFIWFSKFYFYWKYMCCAYILMKLFFQLAWKAAEIERVGRCGNNKTPSNTIYIQQHVAPGSVDMPCICQFWSETSSEENKRTGAGKGWTEKTF